MMMTPRRTVEAWAGGGEGGDEGAAGTRLRAPEVALDKGGMAERGVRGVGQVRVRGAAQLQLR